MKISINTGNKKIYIPVSFSLASAFVMMIPSKEISKEDKKTIPRGPRAFVDTVVFGTERIPCVFCDPCV